MTVKRRPFVDADPDDAFWARVRLNANGCWEWVGVVSRGYGFFHRKGIRRVAHRWLYQRIIRTLADEETLDHLCRNRRCVNPDHLEPVSSVENVMRGESPWAKRARQTHCHRGHEFTFANTYISSRGTRICRACGRIRWHMKKERLEA